MKITIYKFVFFVIIVSCAHSAMSQVVQSVTDLSNLLEKSHKFSQTGQYDSVIHYLERGLAQKTNRNNKELLAKIYFELGVAYSKTGKFSKGTEYQLQSIEVKKEIGDSVGIGNSLNHIGFNYDDLGAYDTSIAYYEQSMQYREALNDLSGVAWNLNNIAIVHRSLGETEKSLEFHQRALNIREAIGDKRGIAASLSNLSSIHSNRGDIATAVAFLHRVLEIVDKNEDKYQRANVLQNLGVLYTTQGQHKKSLEQYLEVQKLREDLGDITMLMTSMGNVASAYSNLNEQEKCLAICREIIEIGRKEGIESYSGVAYYLLGTIYERREQYDSALFWIQQDPALLNYNSNPDGASRILILGRIYVGQGKLNQAIDWFEKGINLARKRNDFRDLKNISDALYNAYKQIGNSSKALQSLELYYLYRDSLMSEDNQRALIESEYRYQYEKAAMADSISNAKAVEVKNAQIAQQHAEIKAKKNQQYGLFGGLGLMIILATVFFTQRNRISTEKELSESLLLNILAIV